MKKTLRFLKAGLMLMIFVVLLVPTQIVFSEKTLDEVVPASVADVDERDGSRVSSVVFVDNDFTPSTPGWNYDHFQTIQEGINNVLNGGTVIVFEGTYQEYITIDKSIKLIGENKDETFIYYGSTGQPTVIISASYVDISGFYIGSSGEGIRISSSDSTLSRIVFSGNRIFNNGDYPAITLATNNYCFLSGNTISDNIDDGIIISGVTTGIVISDNIIDYSGGSGHGIEISTLKNSIICGNTINDNGVVTSGHDGLEIHGTNIATEGSNIFDNTIISDHDDGIQFTGHPISYKVYDNTIRCLIDPLQHQDDYHYCINFWDVTGNSNTFYHNNMIATNDNPNPPYNLVSNAYDPSPLSNNDLWDNGPTSGGNYWNDRSSPSWYLIAGGSNRDWHPFIYENGWMTPYIPSTPTPVDGATWTPVNGELSWTGGGPTAGGDVTYDVYFGTTLDAVTHNPPKVSTGQLQTSYNPGQLYPNGILPSNTRFYWKIIATNNEGTVESPHWSFVTIMQPETPITPWDTTRWHNQNSFLKPYVINKGICNQSFLKYNYTTTSPYTGKNVLYQFDWGDGNFSDWIAPNSSGYANASYAWATNGTFNVSAKVKVECFESDWSDPLSVRMYKQGDVNADGKAGYCEFGDINPFTLLLSNCMSWLDMYGENGYYYTGDINFDANDQKHGGGVNFGDINPFVTLLSYGCYPYQ